MERSVNKFYRAVFAFLFAAALLAPTPGIAAAPKSAEEVWKALEKLPPAEREKRLIEGAKAEKEMLWYTNTGVDNANNYIRAFKKAYPFVNAKVWRAKSRTITDRFLTEARAGVFLADVVKNSTNLMPPLFEQKLIGRYESPIRASYPAHAKGELWTNLNYEFRVFAFNDRMISRQEAPKSWEELLEPRWKGKILFDESSQEEVVTWLAMKGKEKTVAYFKKLSESLLIRRGRDTIANLLAAGEAPLAVTVYPYNMETMRAQKAPVDWIAPDMIPGLLYPLTMVRQAPHPYSAALFYDFLLSDAGQKLIAAEGRIVADPRIEPIFPKMKELKQLLGSARVHINTAEEAPQFYNDSLRILDEAVLNRKR
jgi:iron(III) transport system substrate-binding protein